jgi:metal-sulfur cluster biosynthetic enzyme
MSLSEEVRAALHTVVDPCSIATGVPINLVDMGLISAISVQDRDVTVTLQLTSPFCMQIGLMNERMEEALGRIQGIGKICIEVDHSAEWVPEMMAETSRSALRRIRPLPLVAS